MTGTLARPLLATSTLLLVILASGHVSAAGADALEQVVVISQPDGDVTTRDGVGSPLEGSERFAYSTGSDGDETVSVVNLDLLPDEVLAKDIEDGVQEEFDNVDLSLGEDPERTRDEKLPEHRINRQVSLIYQGVYVPDARFNAFVDGVMVNMVAEMKRRRMDPLYFRVHEGGSIKHVPTRRRTGKLDVTTETTPEKEAIGGGVVRGLTKIKRFGNAEVQVAGNSTLVRSHYIFGPLALKFMLETPNGVQTINTTLTVLAAHGLAEISQDASRFLDFVFDSPSNHEIQLRGLSGNERLRRLSTTAVRKLVKKEGRLETRLMRMFAKGGKRPITDVFDGASKHGLWPNARNASSNGSSSGSKNSGASSKNNKTKNGGIKKKEVPLEKQEPMKGLWWRSNNR